MTASLVLKQFGLVSTSVNYSQQANAFLSSGYTSGAGNTYFNAIRFSEGIVIKEDVGQGHTYTFLNGIKIYHLESKELIAEKSYHCQQYGKRFVQHEAARILVDVIERAALSEGLGFDRASVVSKVNEIIMLAMNEDQRDLMANESRKYLGS